jgi:hypothetical protein
MKLISVGWLLCVALVLATFIDQPVAADHHEKMDNPIDNDVDELDEDSGDSSESSEEEDDDSSESAEEEDDDEEEEEDFEDILMDVKKTTLTCLDDDDNEMTGPIGVFSNCDEFVSTGAEDYAFCKITADKTYTIKLLFEYPEDAPENNGGIQLLFDARIPFDDGGELTSPTERYHIKCDDIETESGEGSACPMKAGSIYSVEKTIEVPKDVQDFGDAVYVEVKITGVAPSDKQLFCMSMDLTT